MKTSIYVASAFVGTAVAQGFNRPVRPGGFLNPGSWPMNMVTNEVTNTQFGAFPMGTIEFPESGLLAGATTTYESGAPVEVPTYDFGAVDFGTTFGESTSGGSSTPEFFAGVNESRERTEAIQELFATHGAGPEKQWRQYTDSFKIIAGAQEDYSQIVNRQLVSLHRWAPAFYSSPFVRKQARPHGLEPPKLFTTPDTPWERPTPILPCPGGTPEFVCEQMARAVSATIPVGEQYDNPEYAEFLVNQNLVRQGYRGIGGGNRRVPLDPKINGAPVLGPAPVWNGPQFNFDCAIEIDITVPFRPPFPGEGILNREHELEVDFNLECVCSPTGQPMSDMCRLIAPGAEERDVNMPFPTDFGELNVCGGFDDFDPLTPCETIIMQGVTSPPPTKLPNGYQVPQPQYNGNSFPADPYQCEAGIEVNYVMDSPIPEENNYLLTAYYVMGSALSCRCDQAGNTILSTCRQGTGAGDVLGVEPDFGNYDFAQGFRPYNVEPDRDNILAVGLDQYPYTTGTFNDNVVDQSRFPPFSAFPNYGPAGPAAGFRRQGADETVAIETDDGLTAKDYANFIAVAVSEAKNAAIMAHEAAARAQEAADSDNVVAAEAASEQARSYAAQVEIALAKVERLKVMVDNKLRNKLRNKSKRRRNKRKNKSE